MHLQGIESVSLANVPVGTIVITDDLTPSMTVGITSGVIYGIVTAKGGYTSHSAILSRALGIPAVLSTSGVIEAVKDDDEIIVDGTAGCVILSPTEDEKNKYNRKAEEFALMKERLNAYKGKPSVTADGDVHGPYPQQPPQAYFAHNCRYTRSFYLYDHRHQSIPPYQ